MLKNCRTSSATIALTRAYRAPARPTGCHGRSLSGETAAPLLLGRDPLQIEKIAADLTGFLGGRSTGAEAAATCLDIALWGLEAVNQPVAQLLGGFSRIAYASTIPAPARSFRSDSGGDPRTGV